MIEERVRVGRSRAPQTTVEAARAHTRPGIRPEKQVDVMIPAFDLTIAPSEDQVVVKVVGELDLFTAPRLRSVLEELAGQDGVHVTLDLTGMTFVDARGLNVFISSLKQLRETGGDLALESPSATAMRVLDITGLTSVFAIHGEAACATDSREGAVRALTA